MNCIVHLFDTLRQTKSERVSEIFRIIYALSIAGRAGNAIDYD
jgi:hypothetical protein